MDLTATVGRALRGAPAARHRSTRMASEPIPDWWCAVLQRPPVRVAWRAIAATLGLVPAPRPGRHTHTAALAAAAITRAAQPQPVGGDAR